MTKKEYYSREERYAVKSHTHRWSDSHKCALARIHARTHIQTDRRTHTLYLARFWEVQIWGFILPCGCLEEYRPTGKYTSKSKAL